MGEKLHEELNYMAKVMPVNEYRASWLNEVLGSLLQGDCIHNTYKDFTNNNFSYNNNNCDISHMFFIYCYKESHLLVKSIISNHIISNVTCIKCYMYSHYK